ncbi:hypothetical protein N0V94_002724 [Neodidymelliopsis sp. IMI 364377]|nr:hypothetical protein N0V94_002724 [Neodidymelliopsis sp. IMI 364377]
MVDNKGWRKKIGGKSKELPPIKTNFDENNVATSTDILHESTDRRRHHGWRKTLSAGRPVTPITPVPVTPIPKDIDDTRSEQSGVSTVHRDSRPKAMHYTSLFVTHEEEYTGPIFSEPWGTEAPASFQPTVDPIVTMESIHSHMSKNYMEPIPLEYNSGLFRIFEDYRKLQKHKDRLETLEQEAREELKRVKAHALESEVRYEAEIRRIELLIARGTTGMAG